MSDPYAAVRAHFTLVDGVVVTSGRGVQGIKLGGKMFVMFPQRAAPGDARSQAVPGGH